MMAGEEPIAGMSRLSIENDNDDDGGNVEFWEDDKPVKVTTIEVEDSDDDDDDDSKSTGLPVNEKKEKGWGRGMRERWADKAQEMRRRRRRRRRRRCTLAAESECRLLVRTNGPDSGCICMDMMEVQACRDLGLELPCDWTVEIPGGVSAAVESSSGSSSPIANWTISSPGDDPNEVKARLKVWAQAVALASATHLAGG